MSGSERKPEWANWIEADDQPHLVTGVECRECPEAVSGFDPMPPDEFPTNVFKGFVHGDGCQHRELHTGSEQS